MAQSVEQLIRNQQVIGSNPITSSKNAFERMRFYFLPLTNSFDTAVLPTFIAPLGQNS